MATRISPYPIVSYIAGTDFCSTQNIRWKFFPEHTPHFGGLWEAAVESNLKRVVANIKLTFEEFTTVLMQIEACLNSRPLVPLPCDDDGVDVLTPHWMATRISPRPRLILSFPTSLALNSVPCRIYDGNSFLNMLLTLEAFGKW